MSASLVGSEMCIRDRLNMPCMAFIAPCSSASPMSPRGGVSEGRASAQTCLLYTSDADDDM
eukprot:15197267-Alexandrium_andersonii.AAC.1